MLGAASMELAVGRSAAAPLGAAEEESHRPEPPTTGRQQGHSDAGPDPRRRRRDRVQIQSRLRRHYGQRRGRRADDWKCLQIISPSARTGFGVPSTGGGGTSTALTVASGADSITVTSPISMPFTSATGSSLRRR